VHTPACKIPTFFAAAVAEIAVGEARRGDNLIDRFPDQIWAGMLMRVWRQCCEIKSCDKVYTLSESCRSLIMSRHMA
jgi:hypothetical protein